MLEQETAIENQPQRATYFADCVDGINDGGELTRLLIAHIIGAREVRQFAIKKLDADFFEG